MSDRGGTGAVAGRPLLPLFTVATFAGAFLLFWIQPLFTKSVLPLLGGSPGVWNTALVFFQGTLLVGYLYVHLTTRHLTSRAQVSLHLVLLLAVLLVLPTGVAEGWSPPATSVPTPWLLGLLAVSIGLPFFAVSTTAPLVQRWFAHTGHPDADDPYFLYSASNLGSLVALLAFPALLEPFVGLERQAWLWTAGYVVLALLLAGCAAVAWRTASEDREEDARPESADPALGVSGADLAAPHAATNPAGSHGEGGSSEGNVGWSRRARWLLLAAVPSSLLLGVTSHISTDLASFPLLWIVPLVLYLLTYIVAFARRPVIRHRWMVKAQPYLLIFLALSLTWEAAQRLLVFNIVLHLIAFFVIAMVCHRELAELRPSTERLTEFYLWLSLGGVLGGAFTALAAPILFDSVLEYPLAVVIAAMLRPAADPSAPAFRPKDLLGPALLAAVTLVPLSIVGTEALFVTELGLVGPLLLFAALALVSFAFVGRPVRFALGLAVVFVVGFQVFQPEPVIARERSFFGIHRVKSEGGAPHHLLFHGTTLHGAQNMAPGHRRDRIMYYVPQGPLGQIFDRLEEVRPPRTVGVLGLGSGALSCYGGPAQEWTFFEIDPLVEEIARDTTLFRYLEECGRWVDVVLGDGRLSLEDVPDGTYDLLIFDAFTSDAIPMHLITVEALELYASKLTPEGVLLFHISNRYMDLRPALANIVSAASLAGRVQHFSVPPDAREEYISSSTWAVIARDSPHLALLDGDERWDPLEPDPGVSTWTDDFSNILEVLNIWGS